MNACQERQLTGCPKRLRTTPTPVRPPCSRMPAQKPGFLKKPGFSISIGGSRSRQDFGRASTDGPNSGESAYDKILHGVAPRRQHEPARAKRSDAPGMGFTEMHVRRERPQQVFAPNSAPPCGSEGTQPTDSSVGPRQPTLYTSPSGTTDTLGSAEDAALSVSAFASTSNSHRQKPV